MSGPGETAAFHDAKTRILRLQALPVTALPAHPILAPHQTASTPPPLHSFIVETLNEAHAFATGLLPAQFEAKGAPRPSPPSTAAVQLLTSDLLHSPSGAPEAWFARRSEHDDHAAPGTASWDEFAAGLFVRHSVHEAEYTPEVFDAFEVLSWAELLQGEDGFEALGWTDVAADVFEMGHRIPAPLENRVFAVAVIRGRVAGPEHEHEFVTAQVPVDLSPVKEAMYSNGRHRNDGDTAPKRAKATIGEYVAVERVVKHDSKIVWEMAMASDAKGRLPMSLQKLGVPGAIIKDVGYFLGWVEKQRPAAAA